MDKEDFIQAFLYRIDRAEDKAENKIAILDERIDYLEKNLSQARGWITACLSMLGIIGAFCLEWFRRQIFG